MIENPEQHLTKTIHVKRWGKMVEAQIFKVNNGKSYQAVCLDPSGKMQKIMIPFKEALEMGLQ